MGPSNRLERPDGEPEPPKEEGVVRAAAKDAPGDDLIARIVPRLPEGRVRSPRDLVGEFEFRLGGMRPSFSQQDLDR